MTELLKYSMANFDEGSGTLMQNIELRKIRLEQ